MSAAHSQQIVQKLWNYCHILRDDGLSYGDYVEQLTYLLFLKMAHERTQPPYSQESSIPAGFDWPSLTSKDGDALEVHYRHLLEELGKEPGMLGVIFRKAQNKIQDPAKLRRLVADLIRPRAVDQSRRGRQRGRLRGAPRKERAGHQRRGRPVFHAAPADRRHREGHATETW
jgi:hypothetical protein